MTFDDKKNIIEVCLFESYLAKYFIEHPEFFRPLINKILEAIEQIIISNSENPEFNRMLFSVFSTLYEQFPDITNMDALKQSNSLVLFDTFCKHFTEQVMPSASIKLPEMRIQSSIQVPLLSALSQQSLFKSRESGQQLLLDKVRPAYLFSNKNRGVTDIDSSDTELETQNLGILSSADTPDDLKNYFLKPHIPCYQFYKPKEDSLMALWLRQHYLPVISGASGGIGKTLSSINSLIMLSKTEHQLLGILTAASTIALGHHSFFEVIRPLSFFTGDLKDKCTLLEFYEQAIPEEIKCSSSYQSHIKSTASLIGEFTFDCPKTDYVFQ